MHGGAPRAPRGPRRGCPVPPRGEHSLQGMTDLAHPTRIDRYEILGEIARGGMGVVYRARDAETGRAVALKRPIGGRLDPALCARFLREAELLAGLSHPGIVSVLSIGATRSGPYYTMELVRGAPLDACVSPKEAAEPRALELFVRICEAVAYAHGRGVVHGDLAPRNILVTPPGNPVIVDFGLPPPAGVAAGTPAFMAPEQARGEPGAAGPAADIYALGAVFYRVATGRLPYRGATPRAFLQAVVDAEPRRPAALVPSFAGDLEAVILKAMEKDPARRHASAAELAEDLRRLVAARALPVRRQAVLPRDPFLSGSRDRSWWIRAIEGVVGRLE